MRLTVRRRLAQADIDADRHGIEILPPADYLRMSYYERWLTRRKRMS